jgi:hypothetical protein
MWSPWQGGHIDFFKNTFEELRNIATPHTASYEAVILFPAQGSRVVTLSSDTEAPSDVAAHWS